MDEPFAGVDAATGRAIVDVMRDVRSNGATVVCVHHDLQTVGDYFDGGDHFKHSPDCESGARHRRLYRGKSAGRLWRHRSGGDKVRAIADQRVIAGCVKNTLI